MPEQKKEFSTFHNEGYKGLYGGETVNDIKERKQLNKNNEILDHMGSTELAANWFRITQADEMLKQKNVNDLETANKTHHFVGTEVRNTMKKLSGIVPENLPTPEKSIQEIEYEEFLQLNSKEKDF